MPISLEVATRWTCPEVSNGLIVSLASPVAPGDTLVCGLLQDEKRNQTASVCRIRDTTMRRNTVKAALKAGQPQVGTWLSLGNVFAARLMARVGFNGTARAGYAE